MKKKYILILVIYLILVSISVIKLLERQKLNSLELADENRKLTHSLAVLIEDSTTYIPTFGMFVNDKGPDPQNGNIEKFTLKHKKPWITKAFYNLYYFPQEDIEQLLYSPYPNIRIYGYIIYVKNTEDLNFNYLLQSQKNKDTVELICEKHWIYGKCYVSDILLLFALKEKGFPFYLIDNFLTEKQKSVLKEEYEKKEPINPYMDQLIRYYFDYQEKEDNEN